MPSFGRLTQTSLFMAFALAVGVLWGCQSKIETAVKSGGPAVAQPQANGDLPSNHAQQPAQEIDDPTNSPPFITEVNPPAKGTYGLHDDLYITVKTSAKITVTKTPRIQLSIGSETVYADYESGSGSRTLTFHYRVQGGDHDSDGIELTPPIEPAGGTLKDDAGADLVLTFTPVDTSEVLVDTTIPTIVSVQAPVDGFYVSDSHLDFVVKTSKAITVDTAGGTPRIELAVGGATVYAEYLSGSGSNALTFRYTVQDGDNDSDGIAHLSPLQVNGGTLKDAVGKDLALDFIPAATTGILVDTTHPTITSVTVPASATYTVGQALDFVVSTSEDVTVDTSNGTPRIQITIGAATHYATYLSGSGSSTLT